VNTITPNQRIANWESHAALPNRSALHFHSVQFGIVFSWRQTSPVCQNGHATAIRQCHCAAALDERPFGSPSYYKSISFRSVGKLSALAFLMSLPQSAGVCHEWHARSETEHPILNRYSQENLHSRILEIDTWMPSDIHAISPTVDRLMRLIEGSQCVHGAERMSK